MGKSEFSNCFDYFRICISAMFDRKSPLRKNVNLPKCSPSGGYVLANLHVYEVEIFYGKSSKYVSDMFHENDFAHETKNFHEISRGAVFHLI